jgi:hypothetical protein
LNANEIADLLGNLDLISGYEVVAKAQTMLRQQQAEIEALKAECKRLSQWLVQAGENK